MAEPWARPSCKGTSLTIRPEGAREGRVKDLSLADPTVLGLMMPRSGTSILGRQSSSRNTICERLGKEKGYSTTHSPASTSLVRATSGGAWRQRGGPHSDRHADFPLDTCWAGPGTSWKGLQCSTFNKTMGSDQKHCEFPGLFGMRMGQRVLV